MKPIWNEANQRCALDPTKIDPSIAAFFQAAKKAQKTQEAMLKRLKCPGWTGEKSHGKNPEGSGGLG